MALTVETGCYSFEWKGGTFDVEFRPDGVFWCKKFPAEASYAVEGDVVKVDWGKFGKYELRADGGNPTSLVGAVAGTMATTVCYPLDTVRRRMQMAGNTYSSMGNALTTIASKEGIINGFYQGWWANTVKVVPQNAIRLVMYGLLKDLLQIEKEKTDT